MNDTRKFILPIVLAFLGCGLALYSLMMPMSIPEARRVLFIRGSVVYENDTVWIYLPEGPSALEIEAASVIAKTSEGVVIDTIYGYQFELKPIDMK